MRRWAALRDALSWGLPIVCLSCSLLPIASQGNLRAGQWTLTWLSASVGGVAVVQPPVLRWVGAWTLLLTALNPCGLSWTVFRWTLAWSLVASWCVRARPDPARWLIGLRLLTGIGIAVWGWQAVTDRPLTGLMDSRTTWANWLTITTPIWMRGVGWLVAPILGWMGWQMQTWALVGGVGWWSGMRWWRAWPSRVAWGIACASLGWRGIGESFSVRDRLVEWRMVWEGITSSLSAFLFGHGLGGWSVDARTWPRPEPNPALLPWTLAHQDTLQAWYDGGLVMVLAWAVALGTLAWRITRQRLWEHPLSWMGVSALAVSWYSVPWHVGPLSLLGAILYGTLWAMTQEVRCGSGTPA